jgi:integrase
MFGYRKGSKGGIWVAKWSCPGDDKLRRQTILGPADDVLDGDGLTVLTYDQAQSKAREWFDQAFEQATGKMIKPVMLTVAQVVDQYLHDRESRHEKNVHEMRCTFRANVLPELGQIKVANLTRGHIEKWMADLVSRPARVRTRVGSSEQPERPLPKSDDEIRARKATVNRVWAILRAALNFAVDQDQIKDASAWRKVRPFKGVDVPRVRFLNVQEQVRLVNNCEPEFKLLVKGALFTGARCGELTRLLARDFNPVSGTVFIDRGKGQHGGKSRHIVLTPEGFEFFKQVVAGVVPTDLIFTRTAHINRNCHSQTLVRGWGKSEQYRCMVDACSGAEIEQMTFHELRHTYASGLVNAGVPLAFIADQLGHSDTRMVEKHYGHLCPSAKADAIRKLAPVLGIHEASNVIELTLAGTGLV